MNQHTGATACLGDKIGVVGTQCIEEQVGDGRFAAAVVATDDIDAVVEAFVVGYLVILSENVETVDKEINRHRIWIPLGEYVI